MDLDKIDRKILQIELRLSTLPTAFGEKLVMPTSEIAEQVNLSQPPCWRRIKRLEDEGYILGKVGLLNPTKLGFNVVIYTEVKLTANGRQEVHEFEERIRTIPEVTECYVMLGQIDFLLRIVTKNVESYERLFRDKLSLLPGVRDFNSSVAMSVVKHTTGLPTELI